MLSSLELHGDGRIATMLATRDMFSKAGAVAGDSEGLIDHPRSIAGVEAAALIREVDGGAYKDSLRSQDSLDVERIARRHGGGGHKNAAGFLSSKSIAETVDLIVAEIEPALAAGSAGSESEEE